MSSTNWSEDIHRRLGRIRLLGLDVDGVLTDGGIYMAGDHDLRRFDSRDGVGIKLLQKSGIQVVLISGKTSDAVTRRAAELDIGDVVQGTIEKVAALEKILARHGLQPEQAAFIGDDLPDVPLFHFCGLGIAVANACPEALNLAHLVLERPGGDGAVREAAEYVLKAQGKWNELLSHFQADIG